MSHDGGWWSDPEYWDENFEFIFPPEQLALGEEVATRSAALLRLERGARVLDLGCGPGRVSVPLARHSFRVTGVDLQEGLLGRARALAAREGVALDQRRGDFGELTFEEPFDAVICVFNSFGYFADPARDEGVLRRAAGALRRGGRFLLEVA